MKRRVSVASNDNFIYMQNSKGWKKNEKRHVIKSRILSRCFRMSRKRCISWRGRLTPREKTSTKSCSTSSLTTFPTINTTTAIPLVLLTGILSRMTNELVTLMSACFSAMVTSHRSFVGTHRHTKQHYALKKVDRATICPLAVLDDASKRIGRSRPIVNHPNIIKFEAIIHALP